MNKITAAELALLLDSDEELAILDLREQGGFAKSHLLFARCLPLSTLELRIEKLVPRLRTRIVLCGNETEAGEPSLIAQGFKKLRDFGYDNIAVLDGGDAAWRADGHELFSGVYVPSKAFGEVVEHHYDTPNVTAQQLNELIGGSAPIRIFDSRPPDEFKRMSIPGAIDCPGAELVYRVPELVPSPDTVVIVNCAGRTRSILGAQSLINAGLPNPVFALRNGTMGWELAGYEVDRGKDAHAAAPSPDGLAKAKAMAAGFARQASVAEIDWRGYQSMAGDAGRTCYLFDVRSAEEFADGHPDSAVHAPGGQLIQATDSYIGTLRSRIVLFDDKSARALMTAAWLKLAGWDDVYVLRAGSLTLSRARADAPKMANPPGTLDEIAIDDLAALIETEEAHLIDLASSVEFLNGHIAGARFAIRARLHRSIAKLNAGRRVVLTSPDGELARLAVPEVKGFWRGGVQVLAGGTAAWQKASRPLEHGFDHARALEPPDDLWHTPSSFFGGGKPAMQEYLDWETGLVERVRHEPGLRFKIKF